MRGRHRAYGQVNEPPGPTATFRPSGVVISTSPIGPVVCPRDPVLIKTPYRGPGEERAWQVQIAADSAGESMVWQSSMLPDTDRVRIGADTGKFVGPLSRQKQLATASTYFARVRQQSSSGKWSAWSPWHQPFRTLEGS